MPGEFFAVVRDAARRSGRQFEQVQTTGQPSDHLALDYGNSVGVFLDPPYRGDVRFRDLHRVDDDAISTSVRDWALEHGDDPRLRNVLAGYEEEHAPFMPASWRCLAWSAGRSFGSRDKDTANAQNRHKERIWFSPHCMSPTARDQQTLFEV